MKWLAIILTAMFAGARLANVIGWSWWLVFCPVIIYYGFFVLMYVLAALVGFVVTFINGFKEGWHDDENSKHED